MTRTLRTAAAAALTAGALVLVAACGSSHGTGSITPPGTQNNLYFCSYTPTGSGIKISKYEHVPCVVGDARSTKDRKKATQRATISSTVAVIPRTGRTATVKTPSAPRTTTVRTSKPRTSLRKH